MVYDTDADLAAILDPDEFAVAATFGVGLSANVIFENEFAAELGAAGTAPRATGRITDLTTLDVGETVTISGTTYTVAEKREDPLAGTALLLLESAT